MSGVRLSSAPPKSINIDIERCNLVFYSFCMPTDPYYFAKGIATVVLLSQCLAVLTLLALIVGKKDAKPLKFLARNSTLLALIVAVTAVCSSLIFSDFYKMNPCKLCWYQRIFIFPQIILLGVALWKKHHDQVTTYSIVCACIAIPISIFHYLLQMTDAPAIHGFAPCDVTGQAPSCSGYYVIMYEYITIPMMALTTSILILILMILRKKKIA